MPLGSVGSSNLSDIYGSRVSLPSAQALSGTALNILNQAIPGFSGLTQSATDIIRNRMAGQLSPETQSAIQRAAATQAVSSGMPGSAAMGGTLMGNRVLRDIGATTEGYQQQGFQDLLAMLGGYSGTAALTPAQIQEQESGRAIYAASPDPAAAGQRAEELFRESMRAAEEGGGGPATTPWSQLPWWQQPVIYRPRTASDPGGGTTTEPIGVRPGWGYSLPPNV